MLNPELERILMKWQKKVSRRMLINKACQIIALVFGDGEADLKVFFISIILLILSYRMGG